MSGSAGAQAGSGTLGPGLAILASMVSVNAGAAWAKHLFPLVGSQGVTAVRVGLANEEGFPHEGKLEFVDNQLDANTGSVRMRAAFDNADRTLAPGLFARIQLSAADSSRAVLISDRAVATDQSRAPRRRRFPPMVAST